MESIFHRISIRKFEDKPVEEEKVEKLLKAAMQAPSAGNQQPWEYYVVKNKEVIQQLAKTSQFAGCAANAPVVIVAVYRKEGIMFPGMAQIDSAIALENMWLEADYLGLGGVFLAIAPVPDRMEGVRKVLNLPENLEPFALFQVGYPAEDRARVSRYDASRVHVVK